MSSQTFLFNEDQNRMSTTRTTLKESINVVLPLELSLLVRSFLSWDDRLMMKYFHEPLVIHLPSECAFGPNHYQNLKISVHFHKNSAQIQFDTPADYLLTSSSGVVDAILFRMTRYCDCLIQSVLNQMKFVGE
jgi:hypothetical protein